MKNTIEIEIPFEESINLHGTRIMKEQSKKRKGQQKKSTLEIVLNILLATLTLVIALMTIAIAMAGFSFATYRLAELFL